MKYLVDTNIWLERLLDQESSDDVGRFLDRIPSDQLLISDFSLHSIGVILGRLKKEKVFVEFVDDVIIKGSVSCKGLDAEEYSECVECIKKFKLDFDDAYQYIVAKKHGARIVGFDADFKRTDTKYLTPLQCK
jgi:predicted nucleic acid-binding protein